jgi:UDP-2,3-diacylglucosamine hydrolase
MSHSLELKTGALFIADAHYPNHGKEFLTLLQNIECGKIKTPQLILMGDIFDLLVGSSKYLKEKFKTEITLIDNIAKKIEVIYIEGNHDFNLRPLFKNVLVIPIQQQPLLMHHNKQTIALSHGDKYCMRLSYKIYTKTIRNPLVLKLIPDSYAKNKLQSMQRKKICKKIKNFKSLAKKIAKNYTADLIIEGHYHQGVIIDNYISLPSFACSGKIAVYKANEVLFPNFRLKKYYEPQSIGIL